MKKVRGRKKSVRILLEEFKDRVIDSEKQTIFINHGDCLKDAEYLKSLILDEVKVKNVVINYIGPVIGAHTGPGVLCIAFIGKARYA
jgi:fatty acid-binding protein DegV